MFPAHTEVVHLPYQRGGTFPGVFLFTEMARMMRPVVHLATQAPVLVGSLEQHNLSIRFCTPLESWARHSTGAGSLAAEIRLKISH